jgi:L-aspartate oxidase
VPSVLPSVREFEGEMTRRFEDAEKLRSSLRRLMWGKVGIIRSGDSLRAAVAQLSRWSRQVSRAFETRAALEVKNMVQVARVIAEAALWRENSVGAHYRSDFPSRKGSAWRQHSRLSLMEGETGGTVSRPLAPVVALRGSGRR